MAFLVPLASNPAEAPAELANLWSHLPPAVGEKILALSENVNAHKEAGVAQVLATLMVQPALFRPEEIPPGSKPSRREAIRALAENRAKLDQLFAGSLAGDPRELGWYRPAKLAYSIGYGLVMWLLLFGTVGFFQARFPGHSPGWRYVADSSYWIYLVHLPLVAVLQIWMAPWPWPGLIKFLLLNLVAFTLLFASYHFLVRSTFLGRVLIGRSHPLVVWPFRKTPAIAAAPGPGRGIFSEEFSFADRASSGKTSTNSPKEDPWQS